MKTVKFLMLALIAAFTVNFANAQTSPTKAPVKTVMPATKVEKKAEKKAEKVEAKAEKVEAKADTAAKKVKHKAHKKS